MPGSQNESPDRSKHVASVRSQGSIRRRGASFCSAVLVAALSVAFSSSVAVADEPDPVLFALSARHMNTSVAQLEELAGGKDQLVEKLLTWRTQESPPFVGIRAEKLLLNYADRNDVSQALQSDVDSGKFRGLARIIAVNIDHVSDSQTRERLARSVLERAKQDQEFKTYARTLQDSTDQRVRELARSSQ